MGLVVLAHQGGWDEILLVAAPLVLFAGLVWNAKRRASRSTPDHGIREQDDQDRSINSKPSKHS